MLNNFRSKDKDTLIVFGFLIILELPFVIMSIDKFPSLINKFALIYILLLWNLSLSMVITSFLYINYMAALDNGIKISENKGTNTVMNCIFIAMYCLIIYMLIFDPSEMRHSVFSAIFPIFMIQNPALRPTIVIGETYLTNSRHTIRLDSIKSVNKSKNESLTGISKINIILKDDKEIQILGSHKVYKLICEKGKVEE